MHQHATSLLAGVAGVAGRWSIVDPQGTLFPTGLTRTQSNALSRSAHAADPFSLPELLRLADKHLAAARAARDASPVVNLPLAEAIVDRIRRVSTAWPALPPASHSWLKAAIYYFVLTEDGEPDFTSPIGFEDDVDVLNACLRFADKDAWCLNPEDYDPA